MASGHCRVGLLPVRALLLLAFSLFITPIQMQDLNSDSAALLAFISSFGVTSVSVRWRQNKDTCSWQGVTCQSGRVAELRLPGVGLRGDIPQSTLGNLTALRVLSLRYNALTGSIPEELGDITTLSIINLRGNKFTGEIPLTIFSLSGLTQLNLAENQLSGAIAPDFAKLTTLQILQLELNMIQGQLPDLNLTTLSIFNVSYNQLSGPIPPSLSQFNATSFLGMQLCGRPLPPCKSLAPVEPMLPPTASPSHAPPPGKHGLSGGAIAAIVIGIAAALMVAASVFILVLRRPQQSYKRAYQVESPSAAVALRAQEAMGSPTPTLRGPPMAPRVAPASVPVPVEAASPPRAARPPQREEDGGGSVPKKRLVFFGRSKKTYDLDDLLRASAEVLGMRFI